MRPIQLQMSGLQSYRELQTIDFSQLIDAGVFGIFGPTGSGKSSILDAITLSLYGKVERASGGTQAIMNHAEQTLFVSFTFELTNATSTERYRVERQFKRGAEMSINGTISRLLHIRDSETIVLADKAGEVNQQVQSILGLSMQDFTRAVVLPQGKFAEFLTLTGKDRRQMLQRLFHLETYGDHLSAKVSSKVKETDSAVKQLAAEQQGLGDATTSALEEANTKLLETEQEAVRSRLHLEQQEKAYEENKQVYQWIQESESLAVEQLKHQEHDSFITEKEQLLKLAEQAERVIPYLDQHKLAVNEVLSSEGLLQTATSSQVIAETVFKEATVAYDKAQHDLEVQEGPLVLRLDQLEQALVIQKELEQVKQHTQVTQTQEAEVKSALSSLQAEIAKSNETKQKALAKQNELKAQLKLVETDATQRQQLQNAVVQKKAIDQLQTQVLEAKRNAEDKKSASLAVEHARGGIADMQTELYAKLIGWFSTYAEWEGQIRRQDGIYTTFVTRLQDWLEAQRKLQRDLERHHLAALLAAELEAGEPCPVCGGLDHPALRLSNETSATTSETASSEGLLDQVEQLLRLAKERQFESAQVFRKMASLKQQATTLSFPSEVVEKQRGDAISPLVLQEAAASREVVEHLDLRSSQAEMSETDWQSEWNIIESSFRAAVSQVEECENMYQALHREHSDLAKQELVLSTQGQAAVSLLVEAEVRVNGLKHSIREQQDQWDTHYAGLVWDKVEEQLQQLLDNERLADELRGRLEKSIPFLEELTANIERLHLAAQERDRTALQLYERLQGLAQLVADKSRQLALRAPGAAVPQLIAEATSALAQLRQLAQQTKLAHAAAQREQSLAAQRYSAAAEAAAAAARQQAQTERALAGALEKSGFASREAVEAAALAPEQRRGWAQLAAEHREREQALRAQLAQLAAKLQGRVLSAAEWAQSQAQLSDAKAGAEAALEARAKAAQGASELAARHLRWCELEAQRVEQATQLERLGKLQAVLKANAFVEYLAEEQLMQVSRAASERLGELTRRRYGIEVDSGGGFVIRDDANGGVKRPVGTLSGGETFLTSLALALALSAQIQLKGEYPLEFFFLDEGFGTLDQELLDMVIGALEKLHTDRLAVGVISHVPELRARLVRKLIVHPAEPSGRGSRISLEEL
ncbi:SMC family ATPase [Paenibacillus qinlingensis]|uniref:Nuclease SbcCD subunit C n=1 Tax=Paenibacillus qinlingensis TaxID=1837343 RepID=A0ABU1NV12_9BACL|nr:SMC family ATPase [Paenibacillus qinlingensis]MDR6551306.1 exonuclease SbcC [Paenibacillus qinlingensis]